MQSILKNQTMLIIVALVFGGIGGYVISPKMDPAPLYIQISDLEEENTFLDNQLEGLQAQHESTQNDLEVEKGQYENLQADFTNIENQLVDSQHQNELLENNITEQANTIENLEEELDNLSDTVTEKRLEITQKTNEIDDLHEDISDLQNQITELSKPVSEFLEAIDDLEAIINQKESELTAKIQQVENLNEDITQLEQQIEDLESQQDDIVAVSFSRPENSVSILESWIDQATTSIKVMVYVLTSNDLRDALIQAHSRGVQIVVIIDSSTVDDLGSDFDAILDAGIDIRSYNNVGGIMHHKVMIVDGHIIITGSYNWSQSAEDSNDENIIVIDSVSIANEYLSEFNRIWIQTSSSVPTHYQLTISKTGSGSTTPSPGNYDYTVGSSKTVVATASSGWEFDHWELDGVNVGTSDSYIVTMNNDHSLTAIFIEEEAPPPPPAGKVVINEVEANPAGTDTGNEWVELYNPSAYAVDIGGWTVSSTAGVTETRTISTGTTLNPGHYYIVTYSGQWIDNENENMVLKDSLGTTKDASITFTDTDNDGRSWQRYPNGYDTNSNSDWSFRTSTKNSSN